ncbi:hypothetical protein Hanom_Chr02g00153051 [Helianthus anomalus]
MDVSLTSNDMKPETISKHCSVGPSWKSFVRKVVPYMICEEPSCLIGWYGEKVSRLDPRNDVALFEPYSASTFWGACGLLRFCVFQ